MTNFQSKLDVPTIEFGVMVLIFDLYMYLNAVFLFTGVLYKQLTSSTKFQFCTGLCILLVIANETLIHAPVLLLH